MKRKQRKHSKGSEEIMQEWAVMSRHRISRKGKKERKTGQERWEERKEG